MTSATIIDFYKIVRSTPAMWADLAEQPDVDTLLVRAKELAKAKGILFSNGELRNAAKQIDVLIKEVVCD